MSQETETIKERLDIAEVIGEYVQLKQNGRHFKGLCPFHSEKTPSFVVSPDKGMWHCFGCQEGGDVFSFIQKAEGLEFRPVLEQLAERAGVTLSKHTGGTTDPRQKLWEIMSLATKFYHEILVNQAAGQKALEYLHERGLKDDTISEFQIGYAPNNWDTLQKFLLSKGFTSSDIMAAGLIGQSDRGTYYDRFRGRIIFPIQDVRDRHVAFGGRIVPWHATGNEGKYINSPESSIYVKRQVVFNLNRARDTLRQKTPALVVEGYMDVAMLHQADILNSVASSGTAFTPEQVQLIKRYTNEINFAFDADAAGIKAAVAATAEALKSGLRVNCIPFPAGHDPADIVQQKPDQLIKILANHKSLPELLFEALQNPEHQDQQESLLENLLPLLKNTTHTIQQGEMIRDISSLLSVPDATIIQKINQINIAPAASPEDSPTAEITSPMRLSSEQLLTGYLLRHPALKDKVSVDINLESSDESLTEALKSASAEHEATLSGSVEQEVIHLSHQIEKQTLMEQIRQAHHDISTASPKNKPAALKKFRSLTERLAFLS